MNDIFTSIFLTSFFLLMFLNGCNVLPDILQPFLITSFLAAITAYFLNRPKIAYFFLVCAFSLLLGIHFLKYKVNYTNTQSAYIPVNQYVTLTGKLLDFPEIRKDHSLLLVRAESMAYHRKTLNMECNIRIRVNGQIRNLYRGDKIRIGAKVRQYHSNHNFFKNPGDEAMLEKNIHFIGYCKSKTLVELLNRTSIFWSWVGKWRSAVRKAIEKRYMGPTGELQRNGLFLEAILLGDRGMMNAEVKEGLLNAGLYHIFAISGAHIGILAIFAMFFLKKLGVPLPHRYWLTGIVLTAFLILSGSKVSAERAVIIALLIFMARGLQVDVKIFNVLSFSGLILLFKHPATFIDPGFVLTYTITMAIIWGRQIFLRVNRSKPLVRYVKELLSANFSASVAALPLSLYYFKRYSFGGILVGPLALPLVALAIMMGIPLIVVAPLSATLSKSILILCHLPLSLFFMITDVYSNHFNLTLYRPSPHPAIILAIIIGLFGVSRGRFSSSVKIIMLGILLLLIGFVSMKPTMYKPEHLELFFLDVGQGDATLIVFPGGKTLLIDGGGSSFSDFEVGKNIVLPFILQKKLQLKWMAISHYHPDHARGITELVNILEPEEVWISSAALDDPYYRRLVQTRHKSGRILRTSKTFSRRVNGVRLDILFPEHFIVDRRTHNNHSQVIKITDQYHQFLFPGDIEADLENYLCKSLGKSLMSNVLKVPHHGSNTSSSQTFIDRVKPDVGIISCGYENPFGFPHEAVLRRYKKAGVNWLSTAQRGGIGLVSLPTGIEIITSK